MPKSFLKELVDVGEVILFGSILDPRRRNPSDIDIAVIAPDDKAADVYNSVRFVLSRNKLERFARVQNLLAYERSSRESESFLHILVCNSADLASNHPIVKKVQSGFRIRG